MSIDVLDVFGLQSRVLQRSLHRALRALAVRGGGGQVVSIAGGAIADDLGVDLRATLKGVLQFFENHYPRSFAHYESIASGVERTRRSLRAVVPLRQGLHVGESADRHGSHCRLGATRDHDICVAVLDRSERITYRVSTGRASRYSGIVWPFRIEQHRDDAGGDIGDEHWDEEGRDLSNPALPVDVVLFFEALEAPDTAADDDANAVGVDPITAVGQARVRHGLPGAGDRVLGVLVRAFRLLALHVVERVEPLHLRSETDWKFGRVELRDGRGARFSFDQ